MHPRSRQRGMSMWALLGLLIVIGFVALMAIRLVPVYMTYWDIVSIAQSVRGDTNQDTPMTEVWHKMRTRFDLNGIHDLKPRKIMHIRHGNNSLAIQLDYEVRRPLFANIDLIATFDRTIGH